MLWKLVEICLLTAGPEDLPAAPPFLALTLIGYLLVDILIRKVTYSGGQAVLIGLVDLLMLMALIQLVLRYRAKPLRFNQTAAAMAGTGQLLGLLALPVIQGLSMAHDARTPAPGLAWLYLILLVWSLLVSGHILRRALEIKLATAIGISILYALVSILTIQALFPQGRV